MINIALVKKVKAVSDAFVNFRIDYRDQNDFWLEQLSSRRIDPLLPFRQLSMTRGPSATRSPLRGILGFALLLVLASVSIC